MKKPSLGTLGLRQAACTILLAVGLVTSARTAKGAMTPEVAPAVCTQTCSAATAAPEQADLEARWGIQVSSIRLSANGNILDFRYRVMDPDKAAILGNSSVKPLLIDQETGAELHVPSMPKVGPMRSTAQRLRAGKIYIALFSNPHGDVKKGHKVTVVFGDCRAENLIVGE